MQRQPHYIADQRLRILHPKDGVPRLADLDVPRRGDADQGARGGGRRSGNSPPAAFSGAWQPADRGRWVAGQLAAADHIYRALPDAPAANPPGRRQEPEARRRRPAPAERPRTLAPAPGGLREVVLSEAGEGKSTTLEYLVTWTCAHRPAGCAFLVRADELPASAEKLLDTLVDKVLSGNNSVSHLSPKNRQARHADVRGQLARLAMRGELLLAFDGIDHASDKQLKVLGAILNHRDTTFATCRIILGSRPYRIREHFETLFGHQDFAPGWQFLWLEPFDEPQQRLYLGKDSAGRDRYDNVPVEAQPLLAVPRVLYYLSLLDDAEFAGLSTPSDVFWKATRKMLADGLANSTRTKQVKLEDVQMLLAAIAFTMVADGAEPNFRAVDAHAHAMKELAAAVIRRQQAHYQELKLRVQRTPAWWDRSLKQLAALNTVVQFGFLEQNAPSGIQFRDRGLQEFYAGLWMSLYAPAADAQRLWGLVYLPQDDSTGDYYWMWRYAAEIPAEARPPAKTKLNPWVRSLGVVYRPGDGTAAGTKRSCEIIYRSWEPMQAYAIAGDKSANDVIEDWQSEFEDVLLNSNWSRFEKLHGHDWGSPSKGKKTTRQDVVWSWAAATSRAHQFKNCFIKVPAGRFRMGSRKGDEERYDDEPNGIELSVGAFQLSRFPTLIAWYHLFDPRHDDPWLEDVGPEGPATEVDWYDAWVFCQWARWDGESCRLADEVEWEYAAKAGTDWRWRRWWGDEADASRMTFKSGEPTSLEPAVAAGKHAHDNPWGFRDILGNVYEWTSSWYEYDALRAMEPSFVGDSRVLRGGSWNDFAGYCRSAYRYWLMPDLRYFMGFRVART
ncbi:MAG: SUMF1/EgtB/PvdO family nonheme iron enzyme [Pirellulales bacterium]|nr:SUMF1/EgtB/PvdO family nonheme iron enzyme [Pirellulales bacterium]